MGNCIFEDVCDKSWCRLYSFECVDGQIYKPADKIEPKFKVGDWI